MPIGSFNPRGGEGGATITSLGDRKGKEGAIITSLGTISFSLIFFYFLSFSFIFFHFLSFSFFPFKRNLVEPYDEYSAEVAVKAYAIEERKAAIEETGGKDVWKSMSWMDRYKIMNPTEVVFKADKEVKGKKKTSHKRH